MTKRAALCLSGQLRNLHKTYNGWVKKNVFDTNPDWQIDVLAHTWFQQEDIGVQYQLSNNRGSGCSPIPPNVLTQLYENYNPKKALIEKQLDFKEKYDPKGPWSPWNRMSKMYSIRQSCALKVMVEEEENFSYDAVIMSRYDMDVKPIVLDKYDMENYNTSDQPNGGGKMHFVDVSHGIMSSAVFDDFSLLYAKAVEIVESGQDLPSDERIAHALLDEHDITVVRHKELAGYDIIRS